MACFLGIKCNSEGVVVDCILNLSTKQYNPTLVVQFFGLGVLHLISKARAGLVEIFQAFVNFVSSKISVQKCCLLHIFSLENSLWQ